MATTIKVMLNRDRVSATGLYPLVIRIIHNRKKKLIYLSHKLRIEDFDELKEKVVYHYTSSYTEKQIADINRLASSTVQHLESIVHNLEVNLKDEFSVSNIIAGFSRAKTDRQFFHYLDREIESRIKTSRFGTATLYRTTKESVKRFSKGKNVLFNDFSYKFIMDYADFLREQGLTENSIRMYLRNLRSIYNKAKKEGVVISRKNPFDDIKMSVMPTVKRALDKDTMRKIARLNLSGHKELERARDVFMFSFYTRGMSVVDIVYLRHGNIQNGVIYYARNKTNQNIQIKITVPLQSIIDKYRNGSVFVLPYLREDTKDKLYSQYRNAVTQINKHLKKIGEMIELETPLTTYVARHSWATIAKNEGAPISAISEGLGHTTEKTTQIYLRAFDRSVIDEINEKIVLL